MFKPLERALEKREQQQDDQRINEDAFLESIDERLVNLSKKIEELRKLAKQEDCVEILDSALRDLI